MNNLKAESTIGEFTDILDLNSGNPVPIFDVAGRALVFQYKDKIKVLSYKDYNTPGKGDFENAIISADGELKTTSAAISGELGKDIPSIDIDALERIVS